MIPLDTESLEIIKRRKTKPILPRVIMFEFMEAARLLVSKIRVLTTIFHFFDFLMRVITLNFKREAKEYISMHLK